ncbi:MAG: hypothetical protein JSS34_00575 [Proteobacteria bacterium]|nr:hypothetical protein [Pseudomonadota bacterium]
MKNIKIIMVSLLAMILGENAVFSLEDKGLDAASTKLSRKQENANSEGIDGYRDRSLYASIKAGAMIFDRDGKRKDNKDVQRNTSTSGDPKKVTPAFGISFIGNFASGCWHSSFPCSTR